MTKIPHSNPIILQNQMQNETFNKTHLLRTQ